MLSISWNPYKTSHQVLQGSVAYIRHHVPRKGTFSRNVLTVMSGTSAAQAISLLAAPVVTRLFAPEAFGILALFTAIASILAVVACMSYELAIVLPADDDDAANLFGASLVFATLISLSLIPVVWLGGDALSRLFNAPALAGYLWLVPISVAISGWFVALNYWNTRTKHFARLSVVKVSGTASSTSAKLGAGFMGHTSGGALIGAQVGGQVVVTTFLGVRIWRDHKNLFLKAIRWGDIFRNVKRYHKFPAFYMGSNLVNAFALMAPAFVLSFFFSPIIVGFYALGLRILQTPLQLLGKSIGQVFFQKASEVKQQGQLAPVLEKMFSFLVVTGLFPILMISLVGQDLFVVVFGSDWAEAGAYAQILSVSLALFFISSPLTVLNAVLEKQGFSLMTSTALLVLRAAGLAVGGVLHDAKLAILLFSIAGALVYGCRIFVINSFAGITYGRTAQIISKGLIPFAAAALLFWSLALYGMTSWVSLVVAFIMLGVYVIYVLSTQRHIFYSLRSAGGKSE